MDILNQMLSGLNNVPAGVWSQIMEILISAIIVSPVALGLKKWWKVHSEKVMVIMVMVGSIAAAMIAYLQTRTEFEPYFIAIQGALVFATTQPVYYFLVKPLWIRLVIWFNAQVEQAKALDDTKSAELPAQGLPISSEHNANS